MIISIDITEEEVYETLASLDATKLTGPHGIGPRILKCCAVALCGPLHHLYTLCLLPGQIPKEWSLHCIISVSKSGDRYSVYSPISILCTTSLVLESIISRKSSKSSTTQFGFRNGHLIVKSMLMLYIEIFEKLLIASLITTNSTKLNNAYLTSRFQYVHINNQCSGVLP